MISKQQLRKQINVANKKERADFVIRNANIVNVFTKEIIKGDIAITDGVIVGIGSYEGIEELDANGRYVSPGLIDAHVHIESSMVTPVQFSHIVLPHGITSVITDPHEIANVVGVKGIQFMLDDSETCLLDIFVMLPSCVPATPFENAGASLQAEHIRPFLAHKRVLGLAEVMDFPAVLQAKEDMLDKLLLTKQKDGHAAGLTEQDLNVYRTAGILTDHECVTKEEALMRLRLGMYVMLREGSVAKNLHSLLAAVTEQNAHRCIFCTDDKHLDDLIEEGSIDYNVRVAISQGLSPITAISMGSLYAAQCYGLHQKGAIAPGYDADLLLLDNLDDFTIAAVYKKGKLVAKAGVYVADTKQGADAEHIKQTVHIPNISEKEIAIEMAGNTKANVIGLIPNNLLTNHLILNVDVNKGKFIPSIEKDLLKIAVIERHTASGNIGLGIVKGFGLQSGAIATTVAHDSHNIIAVATNDADLLAAIRALDRIQGGLVVVKDGVTIAELPLSIGGLMSDKSFQEVYKQIKQIDEALQIIGAPLEFNPFLTLSFLSLPVIPSLKITDLGLFDVEVFQHIEVRTTKN